MSDGQYPEVRNAEQRRCTPIDILVYFPWALALAMLVGLGCWMALQGRQPRAGAPRQLPRPATAPVTVTTQPAQPASATSPSSAAGGTATTPFANLPVVCIDPGHPSETTTGHAVQNGLREVEVVYDVALKLRAELEGDDALQQPIARVVLTREFREYDPLKKTLVSNRRRAEIANGANAALFLRLHCDTGKGSGFTVYYPDKTVTKDGRTGPSATIRQESARAARAIHRGLTEVLAGTLRDNGVKGESATFVGGKQGALTGSIFSDVPVVTVEMVYLSSPRNARFIGSKEGRQAFAQALALGISYYLNVGKER
ncbi:MAG: N-acetylmuramoyl-L-alanine amidase family protein [Armatimonadota bacterium]